MPRVFRFSASQAPLVRLSSSALSAIFSARRARSSGNSDTRGGEQDRVAGYALNLLVFTQLLLAGLDVGGCPIRFRKQLRIDFALGG